MEHDANDRLVIERAFKFMGKQDALYVTAGGDEAIDYLAGEGKYNDRNLYPVPTVILLELKTPITTGFDVLKWRMERPEFKTIPVIIISSSNFASDINKAYELGASAYMVKPVGLKPLATLIGSLTELCGEVVVRGR